MAWEYKSRVIGNNEPYAEIEFAHQHSEVLTADEGSEDWECYAVLPEHPQLTLHSGSRMIYFLKRWRIND
jgi:hypothetical protein